MFLFGDLNAVGKSMKCVTVVFILFLVDSLRGSAACQFNSKCNTKYTEYMYLYTKYIHHGIAL